MSMIRETSLESLSFWPAAAPGAPTHRFAVIGALAAATVALAVLAGWLFGIGWLTTLLPGTTPMKVTAAVGVFFLSAAILAQAESVHASIALAGLAIVIGAAAAVQYVWSVDLGIDPRFAPGSAADRADPGRMSIEAALLLVSLGAATVLSALAVGRRLAGALVTMATLGSLFMILRYVYGASDLYGKQGPTRLAVPAAVAFLFIALAVAALGPARGWFRVIAEGKTTAARMGRWLVPAAILIPATASGLRLAGERLGLYSRESSAALGVAAIAVLFVGVILLLMRVLDRIEIRQRAGDDELRRSEERLRLAARATNDALYDWDVKSGSVWWSEGLAESFGWDRDAVIPRLEWWEDRIHPDERAGALASLDAAVSGPSSAWTLEYRFRHADGSWRDVLERGFVVRAPDGRAERMIGAITDMTVRKDAERVLREANEELERRVAQRAGALATTNEALADEILMRRSAEIDLVRERDFVTAVLATLSTVLVVLDREGRIVRMNEAAERLSGWAGAEVESAPFWTRFVPPEERDEVLDVFRRVRAGDVPMAFENNWRTRSGELRRIAWSINAIWGPDGEVEFIIASGVDLTEERRTQRELEKQRNDLEALAGALAESNAELEAFSYSVSHDLRAPLRAIEGFGQALEEDAAQSLEAQSLNHLRRIRAASRRMGELIDALLALSRISRSEMRREQVSLAEWASEVLDRLRGQDPSRTAQIDVAPGLVAWGDPRLLRIVIENLLENAWKFTSRTDPARIEVGRVARDGDEIFFVRDNGAGFDMAYAAKLFTPFQRLHAITEFPGTGIGLATVRRIIQRHGGRVWAEGVPGAGASFFFTVPREA